MTNIYDELMYLDRSRAISKVALRPDLYRVFGYEVAQRTGVSISPSPEWCWSLPFGTIVSERTDQAQGPMLVEAYIRNDKAGTLV